MRRPLIRPLLVLAAGAVALLGLSAGPAAAGGPTSVLVTSPTHERATALYHTDARYLELSDVLAPERMTPIKPAPVAPADQTTRVTVSWLAHDVSVWRVDYVALGDRPMVCSQTIDPTRGDDVEECTWARPDDPAALVTVLTDLGLLAGTSAPSSAGSPAAAPAGSTAARPAASDPAGSATAGLTGGSGSGWLWALGGVVAGVLGTVLLRTATRGREPVARLVDRSAG